MLCLKNEPLDFLYASNFFTPAMPGESLRCLVQPRREQHRVPTPTSTIYNHRRARGLWFCCWKDRQKAVAWRQYFLTL